MEWSLDAIASSLRLEFEEGYNDRYTFTLTDNKLSVDDLHLEVNVCTIEPYGEGYILHPHEETVDAIVLDGTSENPWLVANQFVDLYDEEHPVSREMYEAYLEHKVEQLEASLAEKQGELVALDILKTNKDTEIAALKEENARLISELNKHSNHILEKGELKMFKDELLALQQKANPRRDITHIVAEFKETIRSCVKDGFCKDNKMSFPIAGGKISCKNPLYNEPTCFIEDLSAVEKAFKKEGIDMDWSYDKTHLNGTLTFSW